MSVFFAAAAKICVPQSISICGDFILNRDSSVILTKEILSLNRCPEMVFVAEFFLHLPFGGKGGSRERKSFKKTLGCFPFVTYYLHPQMQVLYFYIMIYYVMIRALLLGVA